MLNNKSLPLLCAIQITLLASCDGNVPSAQEHQQALDLGSDQNLSLTNEEHLSLIWIDTLDIWVGETEITLGQLKAISKEVNGKHDNYSARYIGREDDLNIYPAVMISWGLAKDTCELLNRKYENLLPEGYIFRLPFENEWEKFARCGEDWLYPWGNAWPPGKMANGVLPNLQGVEQIEINATNSKPLSKHRLISGYEDGWPSVAPTYKTGINPWGLYGIGGNVSEWSESWYDKNAGLRLLKGAFAFTNLPSECEISSRSAIKGQSPVKGFFFWGTIRNQGNIGTGFRVVIGPKTGS